MSAATFLARLACGYGLLLLAWWLWCEAVLKVREMRGLRAHRRSETWDDDRALVARAHALWTEVRR